MSSPPNWEPVEEIAHRASASGTLGVAIIGPHGDTWHQHGDRLFSAASTVKIAIMIEIFRQIDAGHHRPTDRLTVTGDDKADGSGVLRHLHAGLEVTLADLLYLMIAISDNTATNLLIRLAGMSAIGATMQGLGMARSTLRREMRGRPAMADEPENHATPIEYVQAIAAILDGSAATPESCRAMEALLERQTNPRRIGRHVAASAKVRWGSKTGSIPGVTNDVGYVIGPNGRLVIAAFCENFPDQHTGEQVIGDLTRAALAATGVAGPLYLS
jgi:beta-lactamase class A